jgi:hypothetical protein
VIDNWACDNIEFLTKDDSYNNIRSLAHFICDTLFMYTVRLKVNINLGNAPQIATL